MNSFDRLDGFIGVVEAIAGSNDVIQNGDMAVYNLHADPSYVPAYSGESGKTDFTQSSYYATSGKNYKCVELLGWSKRLDEAIARADVAAGIDGTYDDLLS